MTSTGHHLNGHTERVHWPRSPLGRFICGYPVSGYWNTNATFWRSGVNSTGRREPHTGLAWRPGYQRLILRWSVTGWVGEVLTFNGLDALEHRSVNPLEYADWQTMTTGSAPLLVGAALAVQKGLAYRNRETEHMQRTVRDNVRTLLRVASPSVEVVREGTKPVAVSISLPRSFSLTKASITQLGNAVRPVVGEDWDMELPDLFTDRRVKFYRPIDVDNALRYDECRDVMLAQEPGSLYLGRLRNGTSDVVNIDTDSPHILYTASTGRGKSTLLRLLLSQLIEQGSQIDICDVGRFSLSEFKDVDGVTITTNVAKIWDVIDLFAQEMGERMDEVEKQPWNEQDAYRRNFTRRVLVIEEGNSFAAQSERYWLQVKGPGDKAKPAVFGTLSDILSMARKVRMHVLMVGQRVSADVIGGGNNRENFGVVLLANPKLQTWKMFGEGKMPPGARTRKAGPVVRLFAGEQDVVQTAYLTQSEGLEHASNPRVPFIPSSYVPGAPTTWGNARSDIGHGTAKTLAELAELTGQTVPALRKAAQRPGFPEPVGTGERGAKLYDPTQVLERIES